MKALVTGGTGFLGNRLCQMLTEQNIEVLAVDLKAPAVSLQWPFFSCDITREELPAAFKPDIIFHLAAAPWSSVEPRDRISVNVYGTINAVEYAAKTGARMIFTSSAQVYGPPRYSPQDENHPLNPIAPYPWSKYLAEQVCNLARDRFQQRLDWMGLDARVFQIITVRLSNMYGPQIYRGTVIADLIAAIGESKGVLVLRGTGNETRDFVHVDDVARALVALAVPRLGVPKVYVYNIGSGEAVSIRTLAELLISLMGKSLEVAPSGVQSELDAQNEVPRALDTHRLFEATGWRPRVSLLAGLQETLLAVPLKAEAL